MGRRRDDIDLSLRNLVVSLHRRSRLGYRDRIRRSDRLRRIPDRAQPGRKRRAALYAECRLDAGRAVGAFVESRSDRLRALRSWRRLERAAIRYADEGSTLREARDIDSVATPTASEIQ